MKVIVGLYISLVAIFYKYFYNLQNVDFKFSRYFFTFYHVLKFIMDSSLIYFYDTIIHGTWPGLWYSYLFSRL